MGKLSKENIEFYLVLYDELKSTAIEHLIEQKHFVPNHLSFVFDSFIMGAIRTFAINFPNDFKLDLETASRIVLLKNKNLKTIVFDQNYFEREFYHNSKLIFKLYPNIIDDYNLFKNNESVFEENIKKLIFSLGNEQLTVTKSYKRYFAGQGEIMDCNFFYINIFIHPYNLIKDKILLEKLIDELIPFAENIEYGLLLAKLDEKFYKIMDTVIVK
jgi:hypothetical protein